MHKIYTYGGGEYLSRIFNAIAALFNHNSFIYGCALAVVTISTCYYLYMSAVNPQKMFWQKMSYIVWLNICLQMVTVNGLKGTVVIEDQVHNKKHTIDNIPLVLTVFGSVISELGHTITSVVETALSMPDDISYHKRGMMFASKLLVDSNKYTLSEGEFKENMRAFLEKCVIRQAEMGRQYNDGRSEWIGYNAADLFNSTDVWNLVKTNAHKMLGYYEVNHTWVTCEEGAKKLDGHWKAAMSGSVSKLRGKLGSEIVASNETTNADTSTNNGTSNNKVSNNIIQDNIRTLLPIGYSNLAGITATADSIFKQQLMVREIDMTGKDLGAGYAMAKALVQQQSTSKIMAEFAERFLPIMHVMMQGIAYGAFIIQFFLMLLPAGWTMFSHYFKLLIWIEVWPFVYALLNLAMHIYAKDGTTGILGGALPSLVTTKSMVAYNQDAMVIASNLSLAVPMISYFLIKKGGDGLMHFANSWSGGLTGATNSAASEIASGNISMGNLSYNNAHANKMDTNSVFSGGQMHSTLKDGTGYMVTAGGNQVLSGGVGRTSSQGEISVDMTQSIGNELRHGYEEQESMLSSVEKQYATSEQVSANNAVNFMSGVTKGMSQGENYGLDHSSNSGKTMNSIKNFSNNLQRTHGFDASTATAVTLGLSAGLSLPDFISRYGAKLGVDLSRQSSDTDTISQAYTKARSFAKEQSFNTTLDDIERASQDMTFGNSHASEKAARDEFSHSYNNSQDLQKRVAATRQNMATVQDAISNLESNSANIRREGYEDLLDIVERDFRSPAGTKYDRIEAKRVFENNPLIEERAIKQYLQGVKAKYIPNIPNVQEAKEILDNRYNNHNVGQLDREAGKEQIKQMQVTNKVNAGPEDDISERVKQNIEGNQGKISGGEAKHAEDAKKHTARVSAKVDERDPGQKKPGFQVAAEQKAKVAEEKMKQEKIDKNDN